MDDQDTIYSSEDCGRGGVVYLDSRLNRMVDFVEEQIIRRRGDSLRKVAKSLGLVEAQVDVIIAEMRWLP